jgi:hypothetical protein
MSDVSDELRIMVVGAAALPNASRAALEKAVTDYGARLLEDATRIEKARRLDPGAPMITDTTIALADLNARNGQLRRPRSGKQQVLSVIAYAAAFASGGFAGYIAKPVGAIGFAICAVLGVLAYVGNRND